MRRVFERIGTRARAHRGFLCDAGIAILLGVAGFAACFSYLEQRPKLGGQWFPMDSNWLQASVMVALGHGVTFCSDIYSVPGLNDFITQRIDHWPDGPMPDNVKPTGQVRTAFFQAHRYLLYAMGMGLRAFGISTAGIAKYMAVVFGLAAVFAYGLFRLGMNRVFSVIGTAILMYSPAVLQQSIFVRDFSKAPFVLAALFIAGYLIKTPLSRKAFCALSALLGLIVGVGLGFRMDLLVFAPGGILVVALCARGARRLPMLLRLAGVALFLAGFLVPGLPILIAMQEFGGTTAHFIIQGFSAESREALNLIPPSYTLLYSNSDGLVHATENSFDRRLRPELHARETMRTFSREAELAGRRYLAQVAMTFPGDVVTRAYGAVLRVLRGTSFQLALFSQGDDPILARLVRLEVPLAVHFNRYGPIYALLAVLLIAGRDLRIALSVVILVFYICGYPALQFQQRHVFQFGFVALWFPGFLLDRALHALLSLRHAEARAKIRSWRPAAVLPPLGRMAVVVVALVAFLGAPWYGAQALQRRNVHALVEQHRHADLERVETERTDEGGRVWFRPVKRLPSLNVPEDTPGWEVPGEYLVAVFEPPAKGCVIWIEYDSRWCADDYSQMMHVADAGPGDQGPLEYFFAVYDTAAEVPSGINAFEAIRKPFVGIGMQNDIAPKFKGLYRVRNAAEFPLWLYMTLPSDLRSFRDHEAFEWQVPPPKVL